jgi:GWxTD domain-containing protein
VLGYEDMDEFEAAPVDRQPVIQRGYWVGVDPDPTTDINEIRLEHMYRTFRADLLYSHASVVTAWKRPQTRGWDTERGEFVIRWGQPDHIYSSHGGERLEIWRYDNLGEDGKSISIPFLDISGAGKLAVPSAESEVLMQARWMNQVSVVKKKVVDGGALDAVAFKDDDFGCSIYVMMHANADSLLGAIDMTAMKHFNLRTRFYDDDWVVEKDASEQVPSHEMTLLPGSKYRLFDVVRRYRMPFGRYNVACAIADDTRMARAVERASCDATHLAQSRLTSSEILFLREGSLGASFARGGELLTPNPWRAYGEDQGVSVYFEIYNLTVVDRQSRYRVTYGIHDDPDDNPGPWGRLGRFMSRVSGLGKGEPSVAQSFDRVDESHRARERMVIDVSKLPAGRYRLWVTITDLNNGNEWETSRSFHRAAPSLAVSE